MAHLGEVRGCVPSAIRRQGYIVAEFLTWLQFSDNPKRLSSLTAADLEGFIQHLSKRMGRVGLQKPIATLRNLLRFLAADGTVPTGLDGMIDRPRVYRQEQLPRSLPWPTVEAFLMLPELQAQATVVRDVKKAFNFRHAFQDSPDPLVCCLSV